MRVMRLALLCVFCVEALGESLSQATEMREDTRPSATPRRVTLDAPGHVCIEGEGTVAHGGEPGAGWTLMDWRGRETGVSGVFGEDGSAALPPLPAGYYEILGGSRLATLAVVPRPETRVFDRDSFYGVDSAHTQLTKEPFLCPWNGGDRARTISDLIALAGIPHVRDRFNAAMVYGANTNFFARVMRNGELLRDRRIVTSSLFYSISNKISTRHGMPSDLAALRDLCARAAADFGHCLANFEFMNEVDLDPKMAVWDYAAAMKAASLGFRTAPWMPVVPSGLTDTNPGGFYFRTLLNNDAAKFADVFNLHTYLPITGYRNLVGRTRARLAGCGFGNMALWFTEVGTNMEGHSREDGAIAGFKAHSPEQELVVAEFLPKSLVSLQMEGIARAYFFVFHPYSERGGNKDWGIMRRDGTVKPAYAAMSAMTAELVSAWLVGEIDVGDGARAFLFEQPDGSQTVAFWSASQIDAGDGEGIAPTPDLAREVKLPANPGSYRLTDMCGMVSTIAAENGVLSLPATRFPAYVSGLHGLSADKQPAKACGRPTPYHPAPDEDLSIIVRAELDERDFTISRGRTRASLNSGTGRLSVSVWNLGSAAKTGMVEVAGGRVAGLPQKPFTLGPSESATFDCVYSPDDGDDFDRNLVLFGRFDGKRGSRLSIPVWLDDRFLASCMTVPLAWDNPARWSRNDSAQKYGMSWDAKEGAIRFDVEWTGENARWFYPYYHLADGETLAGARMLSFEVRSDQDKVENDHGCAYVMLGGNLGYAPPNGNWEKRYVELPVDGIADRREFRIGVNPRGHRLTFWIRNVFVLKAR